MDNFSGLDIVLSIIGIILIFRGFIVGFIKEFFSLGALVLGILSAILLYTKLAEYIRLNYLPDIKVLPDILAFVIIFLIVFLICKILEKLLNDIIKGMNLSGIDKFLGGVLGFAEGLIVICVVLLVLSFQPVFDTSALLESSFYAKMLLPVIINTAGEGLNSLIPAIDLNLPDIDITIPSININLQGLQE